MQAGQILQGRYQLLQPLGQPLGQAASKVPNQNDCQARNYSDRFRKFQRSSTTAESWFQTITFE